MTEYVKNNDVELLKVAASCLLDRCYPDLDSILLDENAPDESRPTRRFFNLAVLAAYELGAKEKAPTVKAGA